MTHFTRKRDAFQAEDVKSIQKTAMQGISGTAPLASAVQRSMQAAGLCSASDDNSTQLLRGIEKATLAGSDDFAKAVILATLATND